MKGGEERSSGKIWVERSFTGSLGLEGALCGGLKKWTKNVFTTIWCRGDPQAVSFQQHLGHTICPQFYPCKVRKTVLCVVKRCLNYFCPIKYLLVRFFFLFVLLCWFGFSLSSHLIFSSLKSSASFFQPSVIKNPSASFRQLKNTQGKHNSQGDLPFSGRHRVSSLDCYSSPPKLLFPLPQLLQPFLWRLSQASPSFLKAGWTGSNCRVISPSGSVSKELCLTLSPALGSLCCDFTHSFLLEK